MNSIKISLSEEQFAQLRLLAEQAGMTPEEFLRRRIEQLLDRPEDQFQRASTYVVDKNAELYQRLAERKKLDIAQEDVTEAR